MITLVDDEGEKVFAMGEPIPEIAGKVKRLIIEGDDLPFAWGALRLALLLCEGLYRNKG